MYPPEANRSVMLGVNCRYNPDTFIWGQDIANKEKGGVFNISKGMQQEFGDARVFNAPIAEDYIVGTANGMCRFDPKIHRERQALSGWLRTGLSLLCLLSPLTLLR